MSLNTLATDISEITAHVAMLIGQIIAIGSLLAAISPPALSKDDQTPGRIAKIRRSLLYRIYRKTISFCAANVGWARSISSPRTLHILRDVFLGFVSSKALAELIAEAEEVASESAATAEEIKTPKITEAIVQSAEDIVKDRPPS